MALALWRGSGFRCPPGDSGQRPLPGACTEWAEGPRTARRTLILVSSSSSTTSSPALSVTNRSEIPRPARACRSGPSGTARQPVRVGPGRGELLRRAALIPVIEYSPFFVEGSPASGPSSRWITSTGPRRPTPCSRTRRRLQRGSDQHPDEDVNVAVYPTRDPGRCAIIVGTQSVSTRYFDPTRIGLNDCIRTGYKLAFLGSDATGLSVFSGYKGLALQPDPAGQRSGRTGRRSTTPGSSSCGSPSPTTPTRCAGRTNSGRVRVVPAR